MGVKQKIEDNNQTEIYIPIVPYDLRPEETIIKIGLALEQLDSVVTNVFQQLNSNIEKHRVLLGKVQDRCNVAAAKVKVISTKNVATTVYSNYKFPSENYRDFENIFKMQLKEPIKRQTYTIKGKPHNTKHKISNKLQFYHVKTSYKHDSKTKCIENNLGDLPVDIESVNSLLLFNTSFNLYDKYSMVDPLEITTELQYFMEEEPSKKKIADAPDSMVNVKYGLENREYSNYFYTPAFQQVPSIEVPPDLPQLCGIAQGSIFCGIKNVAKPIVSLQEVEVTRNPQVTLNSEKDKDNAPKISSGLVESNTLKTSLNESLSFTPVEPPKPPPMPPSPPPLPVDTIHESSIKTTVEVKPRSVDKPLGNEMPNGSGPQINHQKKVEVNTTENVHASLMDAIRKAGGKERANLRSVKNLMELENQQLGVEKKQYSSGSFMSDLYAKLALRRKGISGNIIDDKGNKPTSMADRLFTAITSSSPHDSSSEDDDLSNEWE